MKKTDWAIACVFIFIGLMCLAMSMSFAEHSDSVHVIMMTAFHYCLWIVIPLIVIGFLYMWIRNRKRK